MVVVEGCGKSEEAEPLLVELEGSGLAAGVSPGEVVGGSRTPLPVVVLF